MLIRRGAFATLLKGVRGLISLIAEMHSRASFTYSEKNSGATIH